MAALKRIVKNLEHEINPAQKKKRGGRRMKYAKRMISMCGLIKGTGFACGNWKSCLSPAKVPDRSRCFLQHVDSRKFMISLSAVFRYL